MLKIWEKHIPGVPVHVLENGVDVEYCSSIRRFKKGQGTIFVGVMDYAAECRDSIVLCRADLE